MTVAASGCVSLTLDKFRDTLAASDAFQELLGAANAVEAKAKTWWTETDESIAEQAELPRAVVNFSESQFESNRLSTTGWGTNSPIELLIEVETPAEYLDDIQNGNMWFLNKIGELIDDVKTLACSGGGYSNVLSFVMEVAGRADPEKNSGNRYYAAILTATVRGL